MTVISSGNKNVPVAMSLSNKSHAVQCIMMTFCGVWGIFGVIRVRNSLGINPLFDQGVWSVVDPMDPIVDTRESKMISEDDDECFNLAGLNCHECMMTIPPSQVRGGGRQCSFQINAYLDGGSGSGSGTCVRDCTPEPGQYACKKRADFPSEWTPEQICRADW